MSPTRIGFRTQTVSEEGVPSTLRFPGGEIPLSNDMNEVRSRLEKRGFKSEIIDEMLFEIFGAVTTETTVPDGEVVKSFLELLRSEVGEENRRKV